MTLGSPSPRKARADSIKDRGRDHQRSGDDNWRQAVRQDLAEDDRRIAHPEHDAGLDELAVAHREKLAAHQARYRRPRHHRDRDHDVGDRGREHGDQDEREDKGGDGLEELGEAHQDVADAAAVESSDAADQRAKDERDQGGDEADQERSAGAMGDPGCYVAAQHVRTEEVLAEGRPERLADALERIAGIEHRCEQRDQKDGGEDDEPGQRRPVAPEAAPKLAPRSDGDRDGGHARSMRGSRKV